MVGKEDCGVSVCVEEVQVVMEEGEVWVSDTELGDSR